MENTKIAELFEEIADMLELDPKANRFEPLAYRKAALTIGTLQQDIKDIYEKEGIEGIMKLPGVGKSIAERIKEYLETGKITKYEELKKKFPVDFASLTKIQGMGAKKAYKLYQMLGVKNIEDLKNAVAQHKIRELEGFGERSEEEIAKGIALLDQSKGRLLLGTALPEAEEIIRKLKESGLVEQVVLCGSTRRMRETVGDLDILLISDKGEKVMDFAASLPEVDNVIVKGPTKTTVWLKIGLSCDFRLVERESFGAAMQYFTGNKNHNIKLREIAIKQGYKLNEYGLFDKHNKNVAAGADDKKIYEILGLEYTPPEMREDRGEIELALKHKLPKVVELSDVKGDLHTHTNHSDGANTLEEMVIAAIRLGRKYIGNSDHSKSEHVAKGMDDAGFEKVFEEVDKLNEYGLFDKHNKNVAAGSDEKKIYEILGLEYMPPEMREDRGEIELALKHKLPKVVELSDVKGDLHTHTNHSDGANTLEEMVIAAIRLGRKYIGNSDHSKSEHVAKGMDDAGFEKVFEEVDKLNEKYEGKIKILKSGEVDILKDGSLDLKDKTLEEMDYVIGAVHTNTNMSKEEMTNRVVKALDSGHVDILAHPTDRLINEREPIQLDLDKVFEAAERNNVVLEVNAFPNRLDLNDENILKARNYKVKFEVGTDSHRTSHLEFMRYGIGTARRGWLTKEQVINTYDLDKLLKVFKK